LLMNPCIQSKRFLPDRAANGECKYKRALPHVEATAQPVS
jgi:hypothetical protein